VAAGWPLSGSDNGRPNLGETLAHCVGVSGQHRLDTVTNYLGEVSVVDAGSAEVGDVAVAALVRADI
jgi:hypothetical protein